MSNIDDKTKNYLRLTALLDEEDIAAEDKMSYSAMLDLTSKKYEEMLGSEDWTPRVPSKRTSEEPNLPKATMAAINKAVSASVHKFSSNSGTKLGLGASHSRGQSSRSSLKFEDGCCPHCDEKGHEKAACPHKDIPWYEMPPRTHSPVATILPEMVGNHFFSASSAKSGLASTLVAIWPKIMTPFSKVLLARGASKAHPILLLCLSLLPPQLFAMQRSLRLLQLLMMKPLPSLLCGVRPTGSDFGTRD